MVRLILLTHGGIGAALLKEALMIVPDARNAVVEISINQAVSNTLIAATLARQILALDRGDGLLVLTDLPGATPENLLLQGLASTAEEQQSIAVISGLNLPMLIRSMNYRDRPLAELGPAALNGGQIGMRQIL